MSTPRMTLSGFIVLFVTMSFLLCGASIERASAGSQAHMSIGFESGWDSSWSANDYNSASGLDYWGISTYRSHAGTHSAYCAEVGTNSINSIANNLNHYYDQDMNAWLEIPIGDISSWSSAALSFYAWYVTGSFSLADYLQVTNSSDGVNYWVRWTQTDLSSSGWQFISFSLSTTTTSIAFIFISDPTVGLGPYEGVYIDDIVVTVMDTATPASSASPLSTYQTTSSFPVSYTASDAGGSGVAYVELYYRHGGEGAFSLYTTGSNPSGRWTSSPVVFDSSGTGGDGWYQFYTLATDAVGNQELPPTNWDAGTVVDTSIPSTSIQIGGTPGENGWWTDTLEIHFVRSAEASGIASTLYRLDNGEWQTFFGGFYLSQEGIHHFDFFTTDNAGNVEAEKSEEVKIDMSAPSTNCTLSGTEGANDWFVTTVTVTLTASDNASGVETTRYRIDDGEWVEYISPFEVSKQGTTAIESYATDVAGHSETPKTRSLKLDTTLPDIAITYPQTNSKISRDSVTVEWSGADYVSNIDHYEVRVDGGNWIPMGTNTSYELKGLQDKWYSFTVKAVDEAGNEATTTVGFGIYTSIWSENGPYHGIPLYALIVAIIAIVALSVLLYWRKRNATPKAPGEESLKEEER